MDIGTPFHIHVWARLGVWACLLTTNSPFCYCGRLSIAWDKLSSRASYTPCRFNLCHGYSSYLAWYTTTHRPRCHLRYTTTHTPFLPTATRALHRHHLHTHVYLPHHQHTTARTLHLPTTAFPHTAHGDTRTQLHPYYYTT